MFGIINSSVSINSPNNPGCVAQHKMIQKNLEIKTKIIKGLMFHLRKRSTDDIHFFSKNSSLFSELLFMQLELNPLYTWNQLHVSEQILTNPQISINSSVIRHFSFGKFCFNLSFLFLYHREFANIFSSNINKRLSELRGLYWERLI